MEAAAPSAKIDTSMENAPAEAPRDIWNDGMGARSTQGMSVKEVREMDPSKTSIYNQGVLVHDGMAPAADGEGVPIQGNGLNDLLKWSISNSSGTDLAALRERVARGEYDPSAYREYLDTILGEPDLAKMRTHLKTLLDETSGTVARVDALEQIEFLAESIDNANDLLKVGGLKTVIDCLGQQDVEVAKAAASVIATCTQNNPKCQAAALAAGLVHTLLAGMIGDDERQKALTASFLYALSATVRGHPPSARVLLDAGGVLLLSQLARTAAEKARRRALFLLATLAHEADGVAQALRECDETSAQTVLDALEHADIELQAQALTLILNSVQGDAVSAAEREACRDWWLKRGVTGALQDLAQRLLLRLANGDKNDDDDPAVPLRIAKILGLLTPGEPLGAPPAPPTPPGQLPSVMEGSVAEGDEDGEHAETPAAAPPRPMLALV